jgi:hypothetical protein
MSVGPEIICDSSGLARIGSFSRALDVAPEASPGRRHARIGGDTPRRELEPADAIGPEMSSRPELERLNGALWEACLNFDSTAAHRGEGGG